MTNYTFLPLNSPVVLTGDVVLITGAGQGLGKAIAIACARAGATVILHGRHVAKLEKTYDQIFAEGLPKPAIIPLDFTNINSEALSGLAYTIERELYRLDAIIHCAAHLSPLGPFQQQSLEEWQTAMQVNVTTPAALVRACLPMLLRAPTAKVIFTLDEHVLKPAAYWGAYTASKSALYSLLQILADEWTQYPQLAAAGVIPGPMNSPLRRKTHPAEDIANLPQPENIAPLYLQLLSQEIISGFPLYQAQEWLKTIL